MPSSPWLTLVYVNRGVTCQGRAREGSLISLVAIESTRGGQVLDSHDNLWCESNAFLFRKYILTVQTPGYMAVSFPSVDIDGPPADNAARDLQEGRTRQTS
jgi:hypothetical protein